ncbi:hypothetical protein MUK72_03295 [Halococcus dombrowskii]|uniref:Uncharacterized protein n=1 Tax=Halococcus dombrowskii TaxID=179637 RepID=A0AAX3APP0_HALDO|nr:hypothetical protein [Halococcus dombrowskii]UOO95741.1 hypothetical protein MUK72_03295 [Halococcus dombrowskii]
MPDPTRVVSWSVEAVDESDIEQWQGTVTTSVVDEVVDELETFVSSE